MENSSNIESYRLHPKLGREEAIQRLNASTEAMMTAGTSWVDMKAWADSKFSRLPNDLKLWDIPKAECEALLEQLSPQERDKFFACIFIYYTSAKTDIGSCDTMQSLFQLAGIQNEKVCRLLYRTLTGASYCCYGFDDWKEVKGQEAFLPHLRRVRARYAAEWLSAWKFRQSGNKETSQGDK